MTEQNVPITAITSSILNLTGLGLGYIWQKRWVRWGIHFFITISLVVAAVYYEASNLPALWILILALWVGWMVVDGWRLGKRVQDQKQLLFSIPEKNSWLMIAVPVFLVLIVGTAMGGFYLQGKKIYNHGMVSYMFGDCQEASNRFERFINRYQLTFNPDIQKAQVYLEECKQLAPADQIFQEGKYLDAVDAYQEFLDTYPDTKLKQHVMTKIQDAYYKRADELIEGDYYQDAVDVYTQIEEEYPDTDFHDEAREKAAETYLDWLKELWDTGNYNLASQKGQIIQDEYSSAVAAESIDQTMVNLYKDWATDLRDQHSYQSSIEKYQLLLDHYSDLISEEVIEEEIISAYLESADHYRSTDSFSRAISIYQLLKDEYPQQDAAALEKLIMETHQDWGNTLTQKGKFSQAMEKFMEIKSFTDDHEVIEAAEDGYQEALIGLSQDTGKEGQDILTEARAEVCSGEPASSPAVSLDEEDAVKGLSCGEMFNLPDELKAESPGEFKYAVDLSEGSSTIESCAYQQGHTLKRIRQYWVIKVYDATTGKYFSNKFYGSMPAKCQRSEWFSSQTKYKYGTEPSEAEVIDWLERSFKK